MSIKSLQTGLAAGVLAIVSMVSTPAFADDNELNVSSDKSKNAVTGTVTETKKYKRKSTGADGKASEDTVTEKTKHKTDGTVEKTTESESTQQPPVR